MKTKLMIACLGVVILCQLGCFGEKRPANLPKLYSCKLKIMDMDGKPLSNVVVSVNPDDAGNNWGASGTTDASGVALIRTSGQYSGVAPGKYSVTIASREYIKTGQFDEEGNEIIDVIELVSSDYADSKKTPLKFEISTKSVEETFQVKLNE